MNYQRGYVAILTVLILSAVVVGTMSTAALLSIGEARSGLALSDGEETLQFVEGCVDEALLRSRADPNYNGSTITVPEGSCLVTISKISVPWTMTVNNTTTAYQRKIQVQYTRGATGITISSWKEL